MRYKLERRDGRDYVTDTVRGGGFYVDHYAVGGDRVPNYRAAVTEGRVRGTGVPRAVAYGWSAPLAETVASLAVRMGWED